MMNNEDYKLSVIFCAVDETYSLKDTFYQLKSAYAAFEYIFILSKKCTETCLETVRSICSENDNCKSFIQSSYGLGNAIQDSFKLATGTHMIIWPADNGMDIKAFPLMVNLSRKNPEKIITISRWLAKDGFDEYGKIKEILNWISQKIFSKLYKSGLTDFTNPTQIAPVKIYRKIKWENNDFSIAPELTFKPLKIGCDFIEVPCKMKKRVEGKRHSSFLELVKYYVVILEIFKAKTDDILVSDK